LYTVFPPWPSGLRDTPVTAIRSLARKVEAASLVLVVVVVVDFLMASAPFVGAAGATVGDAAADGAARLSLLASIVRRRHGTATGPFGSKR
jgi:hypothetical protein